MLHRAKVLESSEEYLSPNQARIQLQFSRSLRSSSTVPAEKNKMCAPNLERSLSRQKNFERIVNASLFLKRRSFLPSLNGPLLKYPALAETSSSCVEPFLFTTLNKSLKVFSEASKTGWIHTQHLAAIRKSNELAQNYIYSHDYQNYLVCMVVRF